MNFLPSTKALRCFAATSRLGGIRAAARELNVTQSAVSHQITQLESGLGASLFQKQGRKLVLTGVGQDYLRHVETVLHQLEQATVQVAHLRNRTPLTISAPPTFISNWLLQNLGKFEKNNPGIAVRILEGLTHDKADGSIDVSIEYRFRPNPAFTSQPILEDDLSILASPDYIRKHFIQSVSDLENVRLIETERRLSSWMDVLWDQSWIKNHAFLSVPYSYHALEAARLGYGVALANRFNAQSLLDNRQLIMPFVLSKERWPEIPSYFLTIPNERLDNAPVSAFKKWILSETREKQFTRP